MHFIYPFMQREMDSHETFKFRVKLHNGYGALSGARNQMDIKIQRFRYVLHYRVFAMLCYAQ